MADNELLIKINADAKNATKAFDDIKAKTEDIEGTLADVAKISAVAFAALTAEIGFAVKAFGEAETASRELSLALQNQGIYSDELAQSYREYAEAIQNVTGLDDDQIIKAQATAQAFLGQTKITKDLTQAIVDYGAKIGNLDEAAVAIAKTIGTGVNAFARQGLVLSETATAQERYAKVLEFVKTKYDGLAAAQNQGVGSLRGLRTAFENVQEQIGARFAPIIETISKSLTNFFQFIEKSPALVDLTAALIAGGLAIAGVGIAIPAAVAAFTTFSAAMATFGVVSNVALAGIPLAIGAIVAGVTFLALHWDKVWPEIVATAQASVTFLTELFQGLGQVLEGLFDLDSEKINSGLDQIQGSFEAAKNEFIATEREKTEVVTTEAKKQDDVKKALADKLAADEKRQQAHLREVRAAEDDLLRLQVAKASEDLINLKGQEIAILKAMDEKRTAEELALLQERLQQVQELEADQAEQDRIRREEYNQIKLDTDAEIAQQGFDANEQITQRQQAELEKGLLTEKETERKIRADIQKDRIANRNLELEDRKKYGAVIAVVDATLHSTQIQAAKSVSGELVALAQSKNATLKSIGKAASIAQITIATAESAVNIAKSVFAVVPFPFNIPLAAGLAAARIAFGAEQISNVVAAREGGVITGGIPGIDSVPALLAPGELVVPERNFDQVVGAVQGRSGDNSEIVAVLQNIYDKLTTPQQNTTVIQGDVMTDDSYIDALVRKISDAIEFRNAKIMGVNA